MLWVGWASFPVAVVALMSAVLAYRDGGVAALQRVMNGYTLTVAAFLLTGGSLGDRFGRRKVYLIGIVWFALASADRARAIGAWSGLGGIALAAGPLVGGTSSRRRPGWIFFINIPVAMAVIVLIVRHVPESRDPDAHARLITRARRPWPASTLVCPASSATPS